MSRAASSEEEQARDRSPREGDRTDPVPSEKDVSSDSQLPTEDPEGNVVVHPQDDHVEQQGVPSLTTYVRRLLLYWACSAAVVATVVGVVLTQSSDSTSELAANCFTNRTELADAVELFLTSDREDARQEMLDLRGATMADWCVGAIRVFSSLFSHSRLRATIVETFNEDISTWDTSNARSMSHMFDGAESFNQDLDLWDVSNVVDMSGMFKWAFAFNGDLSTWNTSSVTTMERTFYAARSFKGDLSKWNTARVTNMDLMFRVAYQFNSNIGEWDVSRVESMNWMFSSTDIFDQDLSSWDVSSVQSMEGMYAGAVSFNQDLSTWDVSNVQSMTRMFYGAASFDHDLSTWNVSKVSDVSEMFVGAIAFNQDISGWNVTAGIDFEKMFENATSFNQNLCSWGSYWSSDWKTADMFAGTSCPDPRDPVLGEDGVVSPLCFPCVE